MMLCGSILNWKKHQSNKNVLSKMHFIYLWYLVDRYLWYIFEFFRQILKNPPTKLRCGEQLLAVVGGWRRSFDIIVCVYSTILHTKTLRCRDLSTADIFKKHLLIKIYQYKTNADRALSFLSSKNFAPCRLSQKN